MRIQSRDGNLRLCDAHIFACLISDFDHLKNARLFYPIAGFSQGDMRGYMHDTQVMMGQHHSIFFGVRIGGIDFGVPIKMRMPVGFFAVIEFQRLVHGFFVQGVGTGGVHFFGQGQFNHPLHTLESGVAAFYAHLADGKGGHVRNQFHVQHIDDAGGKLCIGYFGTAVDPDVGAADKSSRLFDHFCVAHHNGAAAVIDIGMRQGLDGDLRAVARRIAHRNADNGFFSHVFILVFPYQCMPLASFSARTFFSALIPSSGTWLNGARQGPTS